MSAPDEPHVGPMLSGCLCGLQQDVKFSFLEQDSPKFGLKNIMTQIKNKKEQNKIQYNRNYIKTKRYAFKWGDAVDVIYTSTLLYNNWLGIGTILLQVASIRQASRHVRDARAVMHVGIV